MRRLTVLFILLACIGCGSTPERELKVHAKRYVNNPAVGSTILVGSILVDSAPVVIRSPEELVKHGQAPDNAKDKAAQEEATRSMAEFLHVPNIDWNQQMILVLRGGSFDPEWFPKGDITSLKAKGNKLTVSWKIMKHPTAQGISQPRIVALVDKFDGEVEVRPPSQEMGKETDVEEGSNPGE